MKYGDYITYDSLVYGRGSGQVIDVILRDGENVVLCEPLYTKKDRSNERQLETIIDLDISECKINTSMNSQQRMRFR
ncbi:hypothetical protein KQI38_09735 [Tissierella carlieri]|uniref:hypothetical protein n=1 Tax=Tissierella carlieri TaxID=689904 RepID=UPI001C10F3BF|nr:hypothetical protein [Tissierella carlieri]MBU5312309.1 hypothetical protein [Tissierella carlieri]